MAVHGARDLRNGLQKFEQKATALTEKAMVMIAAVVITNAKQYVPIDTSALINSDYRRAVTLSNGISIEIGFTQSYALPLHGNETYSPIWRPKLPGTPGKQGGGYNAEATPQFLARGLAESTADIMAILQSEFKNL